MIEFAQIEWRGRPVWVEYSWLNRQDSQPVMVFLHEGLGSLSMWKDFPAQLCASLGVTGLVYSRPAYGRSTPRPLDERWQPDFMHRQAFEVLPSFLDTVGLPPGSPLYLFGHSDGGSIALLYASRYTKQLAGVMVLAPHLFVEDVSVTSIAQTKLVYETTDLKQKLARYHDDVDSAFWGWNDIWLDTAFRAWNIEAEVAQITCPVLAVQGVDDEYGTLEQIHAIKRLVPSARLLELPACGHSPHRDQPQALTDAVRAFYQ